MSSAPLNPFSWSIRRREMLERCPREYFYHYYGSAGGAFANIYTSDAERLHLLRNMTDQESYVSQLLCRQLRYLFQSGAAESENIVALLTERFRREFRNMLFGKAEHDHKRPLLRELTSARCTPRHLEEKITRSLQEKGRFFAEKILPPLLAVAPESRLGLPFPLKINWNDLVCFVTPLAAWHDADTFCVLCAGAPGEENCALLSLYALEKFCTPPDKVRIFHLNEKGMVRSPAPSSFSAPFRRIRRDADRMLFLELKLQSGCSGEKLFPQEHKHCHACRFASFCT